MRLHFSVLFDDAQEFKPSPSLFSLGLLSFSSSWERPWLLYTLFSLFSQMPSTPYVAFTMLVVVLPSLTHSIKRWVCLLIFGVFKPFLKVILREAFGS